VTDVHLCFGVAMNRFLSAFSRNSARFYSSAAHQAEDDLAHHGKGVIFGYVCLFDSAMDTYKALSMVGAVVVAGLFVNHFSRPQQHPQRGPEYAYMNIKSKEFPWGHESLFGLPESHDEEHH